VITPDEFRRVLGQFPTGVTVITTTAGDGRPTGLTASAFTAVSLTPPLVLVCVAHSSQSHPALRASGRFAVNILTTAQEDVSRRFATTLPDKFDGIAHRAGALGQPILDGALAYLECLTVSTHVEGDHTIFVGRVEHAGAAAGEPLLYCRGHDGRFSGAPR